MNNLSLWQQLTGFPYLELYVKLLSGAMQLDVFSDLTEKTTVATLAEKRGWNAANTEHLLAALTAIGFVEKDGERYRNVPDVNRLLVKDTPEYLGGFLQYYAMNEGTMPMDIVKLVAEGPQPMQQQAMDGQLDFARRRRATVSRSCLPSCAHCRSMTNYIAFWIWAAPRDCWELRSLPTNRSARAYCSTSSLRR